MEAAYNVFWGFLLVATLASVQVLKVGGDKICNIPPGADEIAAKNECAQELGNGASFECTEVCILKRLNVIVGGQIPKGNWDEYVGKKYPAKMQQVLADKLHACSKLYSGTSMNNRCDENDEFYKCKDDAVDSVC